MPVIYEEVTPTPIENTTVKKAILNDVPSSYRIKANDGYVLHDKALDMPIYGEDFVTEIGVTLGYSAGTCSCGINYDFTENSREFYAVLRTEVPENQIYGGGNDHEVMSDNNQTQTE